MPRPPVDKRLQNIENGINTIVNKLTERNPCKKEDEDVEAESVEDK